MQKSKNKSISQKPEFQLHARIVLIYINNYKKTIILLNTKKYKIIVLEHLQLNLLFKTL